MPFGLLVLVQIAFAAHAVKTGRTQPWLYIIMFIPGIGCLLYAALELAPGLAGGRTGRRVASSVVQAVNPGRGYRTLAREVEIAPTVHNRLRLADECLRLGRAPEALAIYEGCQEGMYATDPAVRLGVARARCATGDFDGAIAMLEALARDTPDARTTDGHLLYAMALEGAGRTTDALRSTPAWCSPSPARRCAAAMPRCWPRPGTRQRRRRNTGRSCAGWSCKAGCTAGRNARGMTRPVPRCAPPQPPDPGRTRHPPRHRRRRAPHLPDAGGAARAGVAAAQRGPAGRAGGGERRPARGGATGAGRPAADPFLTEAVVPYEQDEVTRLILDTHDAAAFAPVRHLTVGGLRDWLLSDAADAGALAALAPGLTPEMAAAVSKLCRLQDLMVVAARVRVTSRYRTTIGLPGRMSVRLQPNHPADDPRGIAASILDGLLLGSGDACIGINPAGDSPDGTHALLCLLEDVRLRLASPRRAACWRT